MGRGIGVAAVAALVIVGPQDAAAEPFAEAALLAVYASAALLAFAGAYLRRSERIPWLLLGLAICAYGMSAYLYAVWPQTTADFPSPADIGLVVHYPCVLGALILFIRGRYPQLRAVTWLDVCICASALAAAGAMLLYTWLPDDIDSFTTGRMLYALGDLLLLGFAIALYLLIGRRSTPAMRMVAAGGVLLAMADIAYLVRLGQGLDTAGAVSSLAWPVGTLVVAVAGTLRIRTLPPVADPTTLTAIPLIAAGICLPIALAPWAYAAAVVFAGAGLLAVIVRLSVSLRDNARLVASVTRLSVERDAILEAAAEGIYRIGLDGRITFVNPAAAAMLGWTCDELIGRHAHDTLHHTRADGAPYPHEACPVLDTLASGRTSRGDDEVFWRRDGTSLQVSYVSAPVQEDGHRIGAVCVFADVTERKRVEAERDALLARVEIMAVTDQLTGAANRRAWDEELRREIARSGRHGSPLTVAIVDLDFFKAYNDEYGHVAGDALLRDAVGLWKQAIRDTDFLARYGGEEFGVLLPDCPIDDANCVLDRMRALTPHGQTFSAGLATCRDPDERPEDVVARADAALYAAKRAGRNRIMRQAELESPSGVRRAPDGTWASDRERRRGPRDRRRV